MTIPQMWSLSTIWLKKSHFIGSVSDHGKCGIKLKFPTVEVHLCIFWEFSVVAMAAAVMNKSKTAKNKSISMILRHDFPQVHTHVDQYGYIILTSLLLINSLRQNLRYLSSEYRPLKLKTMQMWCLSTIWLKGYIYFDLISTLSSKRVLLVYSARYIKSSHTNYYFWLISVF